MSTTLITLWNRFQLTFTFWYVATCAQSKTKTHYYKFGSFKIFYFGFSDTQYKCMKLFKRTDHVQEIQEGRLTAYKSQACTQDFFDELRMPYTTLLSTYILSFDVKLAPLGNWDPKIEHTYNEFAYEKTKDIMNVQDTSPSKRHNFIRRLNWGESLAILELSLHFLRYRKNETKWRVRRFPPFSFTSDCTKILAWPIKQENLFRKT